MGVVGHPSYKSVGTGLIPTWAIGSQPTQLFILPFRFDNKSINGDLGNLGKINW